MITSSPRILIVDDELQMCNVLRRIMEETGYGVITAPDGETALQFIREEEPDVILLDLLMPGMDGREVCRRVRQLSAKVQIIYFTAKIELDPLKFKELRSEADAFIAKPATSRQILSCVNRILESIR